VFNSRGEGQDSTWNLLGVKVAVATSYKYLGVIFESDLSWKIMKEDRIKKAKQNLNMILAMGVRRGIAPNIAMQLISGSVYQSMDWGSEFWHPEFCWKDGDTFNHGVARRVLRVPRDFPSLACQGELGLWSSVGRGDYRRLVFLQSLLSMPEDCLLVRMLKISCFNAISHECNNWVTRVFRDIKRLLPCTAIQVSLAFIKNSSKSRLKKIIHDCEQKDWREKLRVSHLSIYKRVKTSLEMEFYLKGRNYEGGRRLISLARAGCLRFGLFNRGFGSPVNAICEICHNKIHHETHVFQDCVPCFSMLFTLQIQCFGSCISWNGLISLDQWIHLLQSNCLNSLYSVDAMRLFLRRFYSHVQRLTRGLASGVSVGS